ncbi:MAG TPA: universal stress protein [Usitatibacter sp.]|nr:universal stress protein [Usitatibacter sp.]
MYKHILLPTDGSPLSLKAAREAAHLAKSMKAKITAVYVVPPFQPPYDGDGVAFAAREFSPQVHEARHERFANDAFAKIEAAAARSRVKVARLKVTGPAPWRSIIDSARAKKCDVIVMASHGRGGIGTLLLGSETNKVLAHSKTPVLVCR